MPGVLLLLCGLAFADPTAIAAGADLAAWQALHLRRLDEEAAAAEYEAFLVAWPTSVMAELAWARLRDLGALPELERAHPELRPQLAEIERSWTTHHDALQRRPVDVVVAGLSPTGEPAPTAPPRWIASVVVGGGFDGANPVASAGARLERGPFGATARLGVGGLAFAQAGARFTLPSTFGVGRSVLPLGVFTEAHVDTRGRVAALAGGRLMLERRVWLELATGAAWQESRVGFVAALEVALRP